MRRTQSIATATFMSVAASSFGQAVSLVALGGAELAVTRGESVSVTIAAANESPGATQTLFATNVVVSFATLGGTPVGALSIGGVTMTDDALFGASLPVANPLGDSTLISLGNGPPPSGPATLLPQSVEPLFSLEIEIDSGASGVYALALDPFDPPASGSSYLAGVPPLPTPFANQPDPGLGGASRLLTLTVVPEPSGLIAAITCAAIALRLIRGRCV